jgi:hypothetical protein
VQFSPALPFQLFVCKHQFISVQTEIWPQHLRKPINFFPSRTREILQAAPTPRVGGWACDSSNRETRAPNQENGNPHKEKEWRCKNVEKNSRLQGSKLNLSFLPGRHRGKGSFVRQPQTRRAPCSLRWLPWCWGWESSCRASDKQTGIRQTRLSTQHTKSKRRQRHEAWERDARERERRETRAFQNSGSTTWILGMERRIYASRSVNERNFSLSALRGSHSSCSADNFRQFSSENAGTTSAVFPVDSC